MMQKKKNLKQFLLTCLVFSSLQTTTIVMAQNDPVETKPIKDGWIEVFPKGGTTCARNTPYSFFVRMPQNNAPVEGLMFDFMGGGACWNGESCSPFGSGVIVDSIEVFKNYWNAGVDGIYKSAPNNPVRNYIHVVGTYCTGDIHWGDNIVEYEDEGKKYTIHHKGAVNAMAVINWAKSQFPDPKKVIVTGHSAGSYASIYYTPHIKELFPNAKVTQFGDGGVGVITQAFYAESFPQWNATAHAASWIPGIDPLKVDWMTKSIEDLYLEIGTYYPDIAFGQFTTTQDDLQIFSYMLMGGGDPETWTPQMYKSLDTIAKKLPNNFSYYVATGKDHCIIPFDRFYSHVEKGVPFIDWITDYLNGAKVPNIY